MDKVALMEKMQAKIDKALEDLVDAPSEMREETLCVVAYYIGGLVASGFLSEEEAKTRLREAAKKTGLSDREIDSQLEDGLTKGQRQPHIPKLGPSLVWNKAWVHELTEQVVECLAQAPPKILFRNASGLVRIRDSKSDNELSAMIFPVTVLWLQKYLTWFFRWRQIKHKTKQPAKQTEPEFVPCESLFRLPDIDPDSLPTLIDIECPKEFAELLLEMWGELDRLPFLAGVINAPTLRQDGSILEVPGYDEETGLFFAPGKVSWPKIPERPTLSDARKASQKLWSLIREFPFKDGVHRSMAVAYLLTCLIRRNFSTAPAFGFTSREPGTGKTKIASIGAYLATGRSPAVSNWPDKEAEVRESLITHLLGSAPVLIIDNVAKPVSSDCLSSMLTSEVIRCEFWTQTNPTTSRVNAKATIDATGKLTLTGRLPGTNRPPEVSTRVTIAMTGNNLVLRGNLSRRFLLCELNAKTENPETREFSFNIDTYVKKNRVELAVAGLTMLRAYSIAQNKPKMSAFGGFDEWNDWIRGCLVWIGRPDPCGSCAELVAGDPEKDALNAVLKAWRTVFADKAVPVREELTVDPVKEALYAALSLRGKEPSPHQIGLWLRDIYRQKKSINGLAFENQGSKKEKRWYVTE